MVLWCLVLECFVHWWPVGPGGTWGDLGGWSYTTLNRYINGYINGYIYYINGCING